MYKESGKAKDEKAPLGPWTKMALRAIRKTVGGYHHVEIDDGDFGPIVAKFKWYEEALRKMLGVTCDLQRRMLETASAARDAAAAKRDAAVLPPTHPESDRIKASFAEFKAFSDSGVVAITDSLKRSACAKLKSHVQHARKVSTQLGHREALRDDYTYYLGKLKKLKETRAAQLRKGHVLKVSFSEKLERNEKKVESARTAYAAATRRLTVDIGELLEGCRGDIGGVVLDTIAAQRKFHRSMSAICSAFERCFR